MSHDELTTHAILWRGCAADLYIEDEVPQYLHHPKGPAMSISRTVTHFYGVRVPDDTDWLALEDDPGHCLNNGEVGVFRAGAYDKHMVFLAREWRRIEPGEYVFHSGVHAVAPKFERDRWNDDLTTVADRLGLDIIDGPGWFTMPDEG